MDKKVFFNGQICTMFEQCETAQAIFCSDEKIVFVGKNDEVLSGAGEDFEKIDLKEKVVVPSLFEIETNIYKILIEKIKNAKKCKNSRNIDKKQQNSEKNENYELLKCELVNLQSKLLSMGIGVICEMNIGFEEFEFWKKIVDDNVLEIYVIGYVNYKTDKNIMDENCRSYRKFKNHFRLCGYNLYLDSNISVGGAWINRPYKNAQGYFGHAEIFHEELSYIIKTALEEKKQLVVSASGERSVEQFLSAYESLPSELKEDNFRIYLNDVGLITKRQLRRLRELNIGVKFNLSEILHNIDLVKKNLGWFRFRRILNFALAKRVKVDILLGIDILNIDRIDKKVVKKYFGKLTALEILKSLTKTSAYYCFEDMQRGSLESGKLANFLILDRKASEPANDFLDFKIDKVAIGGKVYKGKNKK